MAALDRPEASGALTVRIPAPTGAVVGCMAPNTCSATGNYYTVELRQPRGWDRAFTRSAVFVHQVGVTNGQSQTSLRTQSGKQLLAGTTYRDSAISVRVDSIDTARSTATVTVTY